MRAVAALSALAVLGLAVAGCTGSTPEARDTVPSGFPRLDLLEGLYEFELVEDGFDLRFEFAPGAVGKLENRADGYVTIEGRFHDEGATDPFDATPFPPLFLLIEDGRFVHQQDPSARIGSIHLEAGETVRFLAPPDTGAVTLQLGNIQLHTLATFDPAQVPGPRSATQAISGESMIDLSVHQEANFPHRTPGMPNYAKAADYFAQYFLELGYEVEVDPFGTRDVPACVPAQVLGSICAESLANIVATKVGTEFPDKVIFVAGGHYDMVPATTHAAFDDTSGVVGTMELARALAPYEFRHTLKFALWGGEENGIIGSQAWIQTHPEARAQVMSYWNLDVVGMSWPAPLGAPSPLVIAAGPDAPLGGQALGPVAESLLAHARDLQTGWLGFPDEEDGKQLWYYEGVASGQVEGYAGVNAQSDHTPFVAAGIPAYFIFNGDTLNGNPVGIHNERDTLANMTKVSLHGFEANLDEPLAEADVPAAQDALARSFETVLWFPFYSAILQDLGIYEAPAVANGGAGIVPVPTVPSSAATAAWPS